MGSKGSRRGPLKTLPIKSYSVQEMAHSSGFGVEPVPELDLHQLRSRHSCALLLDRTDTCAQL